MAVEVTTDVRLHGKYVGQLSYDRGRSSFRYDDDVAVPGHQVLGQVFEDDPRRVRRAPVGLPAWFANLLPEGELRRQVVREIGGGRVSDFRLLLRLGRDLPGAVTVDSTEEPEDSEDPTAEPAPSTDVNHPLRYSLAGVQLKYSVHSSQLTMPVSGKGQWWVVKLPDQSLPGLAVNEYLTMRWLAAAGLEVPPIDLLPADRILGLPDGFTEPTDLVYLTERFDRTPDDRLHYEDLAQVADVAPRYKYGEFGTSYDTMGLVLRHLTGPEGFTSFVARLTAMILTGNTDAHLKNWALWYPDGRTPALAPIYDFHSLTSIAVSGTRPWR